MITGLSNQTQRKTDEGAGRMRSQRGFFGALVLLLMISLAVLYGLIFAQGSDTFTHWVLAAGAMLMALAVFDYDKLPPWIQWVGALSAGGLAVIFFLQGLSHLLANDWLTGLAYGVIAQVPELWLLRLFLYGWGSALLIRESRGQRRAFGWLTLAIVLGMELYRFGVPSLGLPFNEGLRALYLLPFVWLLLESSKKSTAA
jgi:hypothetical protein